MSTAEVKGCEQCGASIYPEHLGSHKAGYWGGKLFCVHCYAEHRDQQVTIDPDDFAAPAPSPAAESAHTPPISEPIIDAELDAPLLMTPFDDDSQDGMEDDPPILLEGAPSAGTPMFSANITLGQKSADDEPRYRRPLQHKGGGATRCRIFHAKLNDGALKFMSTQINEWIDQHPDIEIKQASTQVGIVEGKSSEPHLIITLFY